MLPVFIAASSGYLYVCVIWKLREMDTANSKWIGIISKIAVCCGSLFVVFTVFVAKIFSTADLCA